MLRAGGAGVTAVFLAGCSSDEGDVTPVDVEGGGGGNGSGGGSDDVSTVSGDMPQFRTYIPGALESQSQIQHPWGSTTHALNWMIHPHFGRWATAATFNQETEQTYNELIPFSGAESIDVDAENGTITIGLYDDWQWTTGKEVTAQDAALNLNLWRAIGFDSVLWSNIERISPDGEKTVVIELGDLNVDYASKTIFTQDRHMAVPTEIDGEETIFVEYLERLNDASSDEERTTIDQELTEDNDWPISDTVSCGPWNIVDSTETVVQLEPNDGYHSEVNFTSRVENFDASGGRAQPISAFLSDRIAAGPLPQPENIEQIQNDENKEVIIRRGTAVQGFAPNWNTDAEGVPEIYAEPKFRQAIAYVLNNEEISRAHPTRTSAITRADGVFFNAEEQLPNVYDQLRNYEVDHERATTMLQELGFTMEDGTWMWEGEPFTIDHISPAYHHWPTTGQATMSQLSDFGFETSFSVNEQFGSILWGRSDDTWNSLRTHTSARTAASYLGIMFDGNSFVYFPETIEVPMPVGDWEGSMTEVNVRDEVNGLAQLTGEEYTQQLERLAWIHNYTLPSIPTNVENWGMMYNTSDWNWPAQDDPRWGINFTNRSLMSVPAMSPK